jgi:hypothetical protein
MSGTDGSMSGTDASAGSGGGGSGGSGGGGGNGGSTGGAGGGAGGGGGSAACGGATCQSSEICVHPGCGGGPAVCEPVPDGGQCPSGWTLQPTCPNVGGPGCVPPPCTPPAPFCKPLPASCSGTPSCTCLPFDFCGQNGGQCGIIQSRDVICGFA